MPCSGCTALHRVNPNSKQSSLVTFTVFALYVEDGSVSGTSFYIAGFFTCQVLLKVLHTENME